jgi:hypothetical protein
MSLTLFHEEYKFNCIQLPVSNLKKKFLLQRNFDLHDIMLYPGLESKNNLSETSDCYDRDATGFCFEMSLQRMCIFQKKNG